MDRMRLQSLIEAYGADPARWPAGERDDARALLAQTADAAAMRADARRLDAALDGFAPTADAGAEERLLRTLTALPRQAPALPPLLTGFWPRAAMLAAASVAGVIIGLGGIDGGMSATADVDIVALVGEPDIISLLE